MECGEYRREFFLLMASLAQQQIRKEQNVKQYELQKSICGVQKIA